MKLHTGVITANQKEDDFSRCYMNTIRLYEKDAYIKEFSATVLSCEEKEGYYLVILDKTAFFPEGGGQSADKGMINGENVIDVQIVNEIIYHKTQKPFKNGETVNCVLDWETRFSRMQNHSAEHLVSGIIHNLYGYNNVGFHMNDRIVTLDADGPLSETDLVKIELEVNKAIYENREIRAIFPSADELDNYDYRSKLDITENVRLIEIEGYDLCACCAPHVARTGEIGVAKILNFIPYKKGTRIEMLAGFLAFKDYSMLHGINKQSMYLLSAKREEVFDMTERIHKELGDIKAQNRALSSELALYKMEKHDFGDKICVFVDNVSYDELRNCSNSLLNDYDYCYLFSNTGNNDYIYIVASKENNVREKVNGLNNAFSGKGGGRDFYAQGKITAESKIKITDYIKE